MQVLFDMAAAVAQLYAFEAYGRLLSIHNGAAQFVSDNAADALTSHLHSGEHFDAKVALQYLRGRWVDHETGLFMRLDPFGGNMQDPLSLHKYLFVHADPVQGVDPSGWILAAGLSGSFIGANLNSIQGNSGLKVLETAAAVAAGASVGQALAVAVLVDVIFLGLPTASGAIFSFATRFSRNLRTVARKLPIISTHGRHTLALPGIGHLRKLDDLLDEAFDASRSLNNGNSEVLRKRLEAANDLPADTFIGLSVQSHHVIPKEFVGTRYHSLLDDLDFNIDSALNGIPLNSTYHLGSHPNYSDAWQLVLDRIDIARLGKAQKQELLVEAIANANTAILHGAGLRKTSSQTNNFIPIDRWFDDIVPASLR